MGEIAHQEQKPDLNRRTRGMSGEAAYRVLAQAKELEREGKDIIHLEIGQPDFDTPAHIVQAGTEALRNGKTKYTPTLGIPELREAIAESVSASRGVPVTLPW